MKKNILISTILFFAVVLFSTPLFGHTYWIQPEHYFPAVGAGVKVFICGGHDFPHSAFAISDKVMWHSIIYKDGSNTPLQTVIEGKIRTGNIQIKEKGVYLLTFILKRARDKAPRFEAKSIIHVDSNPTNSTTYKIGSGLEIVPTASLRSIKNGDSLTFQVLFDGQPVEAKCSVTPAGKKSSYLNAGKDSGFSFKVNHSGAYLLTASHSNRSCSLTFSTESQ